MTAIQEDNTNENTNEELRSKKRQKRCKKTGCRKKLQLTDYPCKCGYIFCPLHRLPEQHDCSFNFKKERNDESEKTIGEMKCVSDKIENI